MPSERGWVGLDGVGRETGGSRAGCRPGIAEVQSDSAATARPGPNCGMGPLFFGYDAAADASRGRRGGGPRNPSAARGGGGGGGGGERQGQPRRRRPWAAPPQPNRRCGCGSGGG